MIKNVVLARDYHTCQNCFSQDEHKLQVHHTTYLNVYFEYDNIDDLTTLCADCHSKVDHRLILETWT